MDVVSVGEILIDFIGLATGRPLAEVQEFRRAAGGGPANVAVGAARLGLEVAFIGKVGADAFGDHLRHMLAAAQVDTRGLRRDAQAGTTLAFVALNEKLVPEFAFFRHGAADTRLTAAELPYDLLGATRMLHFSSVSLSVEPARSATFAAVKAAREAGAMIAFDPNFRPALWPDAGAARATVLAALQLADFVKLNDAELQFITGSRDLPAGVATLLGYGAKLVAVTLGAAGAYLGNSLHSRFIPPVAVSVVDTTGAGDAFMAGCLHYLAENLPQPGAGLAALDAAALERLGAWASAAAALTCTRPGVIPALPTRAEVAGLMAADGNARQA